MSSRSSKSKKTNTKSRKSGSKSRKLRILNTINKMPTIIPHIDPILEYMDPTFLDNYPKNIARIKEALKESGKYKINKENVDKFINEQITPIRRQAAKDLIDNTVYIRLQDTMNIVENLIIQIYQKHPQEKDIYMYCGEKGKSFYFFSCIALYYIKKHGFQIPIFVSNITNELLQKPDTFIIIDDASYSGSQLAGMIGELFYYTYTNGLPSIHLTVALTALNDTSLLRLSRVPTQKSASGRVTTWAQTPFEILFLPERLYPSLVRKLGFERYFNINLFFNVWLSRNTNMALYLDHKIADSTSTYKNVYVYGPIVPPDYDITISRDYVLCDLYFREMYSDAVVQTLIQDFVQENPKFLNILPNVLVDPVTINTDNKIKSFLHQKAIERDIIDKRYKEGIQFYPFIQKCSRSTELKRIINDPTVKSSQYLFFMFDKGVIDISEYIDLMKNSYEETNRIIDLLESHRCPNSFYKSGLLKLI